MNISLVLIIYRSNSTIAKDTSNYCVNLFSKKGIDSLRIDSDFDKKSLEGKLKFSSKLPDLAIIDIKLDKTDVELLGRLLHQEKEIIENIIKNKNIKDPIWTERHNHLNKLINKI